MLSNCVNSQYQRILKEFPKNFQRIPKKNSQKNPPKFPKIIWLALIGRNPFRACFNWLSYYDLRGLIHSVRQLTAVKLTVRKRQKTLSWTFWEVVWCKYRTLQKVAFFKVEKILKGSLNSIPSPSPSLKIQIMGGKCCLRCEGKTLLMLSTNFWK